MSKERTMPVISTATAVVAVVGLALTAGGFFAGRATAPDDVEQVAGLIDAQSVQIDIIGDQMAEVSAVASRPVVIDAEIRDKLSDTPPACRKGDPEGIACAWQLCLVYGQSNANRPECRAIEAKYLASVEGCPEPAQAPE